MKSFKQDRVFMSDWLRLKPYSNPNLKYDNNTDLGVFFFKEQGTQMMVGAKETINALKSKNLPVEESVELFISLSNGYAPQVAQYFLENYPTKNIKMSGLSQVDALKNMPYFWRFNSPEEYDDIYLLYTILSDEQIEEMGKMK